MRAWMPAAALVLLGASGLYAQDIAIVGVYVADLESGEVSSPRTVLIRDGVITSIEPAGGPAPTGLAWIDGEGLFVVPGRVDHLAEVPSGAFRRMPRRSENRERIPMDPLDWQDDLLVLIANGVTTLGLDGVDRNRLETIRAMAPVAMPVPRLVMPAEVANAARRVEVGAIADLLLLEDDPTVPTASGRPPLAVVKGGWLHTRDKLASVAATAARDRRSWQMSTVPAHWINGIERSWRGSCEADAGETCFGGDLDCGLWHILVYFSGDQYDCAAASYPADRRATLRSLDRLAGLAPSDGWITGQRVRLATIEGDLDRALESAEGCLAEVWWCQALRGLALHTQRPGAAGPVLDSAYANAPKGTLAWHPSPAPGAGDRGVACEWSDLSYLIEDTELRGTYQARPCGDRAEFEPLYWWLADPLWSQPGNFRRDEHYARNVNARVRDDFLRAIRNTQRFSNHEDSGKNHAHCTPLAEHRVVEWDDHHRNGRERASRACPSPHNQMIRIGEPNSWRGVPYIIEPAGWRFSASGYLTNPAPGSKCRRYRGALECTTYANPQLRQGYLHGGYSFTPDAGAFRAPETTTAEDWALTWNEGYERMLTPETWYNLDHQVAVLRRDDDLQILAASLLPTLLPSLDSLEGFLAVGRASDQHLEVMPASLDPGSGVMRGDISLPEDAWIVSVEALAPEVRGRARLGAPAPALDQGFGISRPVLTESRFDPERDDLLGAMLPATRVPAGGKVGLYIELYGVEAGQTVRMSLTYDAGEGERSLVGRVGGVFGFGGGDPDPVRLEWTERLERVDNGVGRVFVTTDLGDYDDVELELTMSAVVDDRVATERVTLRPRR